MSDNGPFTDEMCRHYLLSVQTQRGIVEVAEKIAEILAEAGRASNKVTGDSPHTAINKWSEIIRKRAIELVGDTPTQSKFKKLLQERKLLSDTKVIE